MHPNRPAGRKVGVFYPGPWLAGGTEKHLLAFASVVASENRVEILTFREAPWAGLGRDLGLDLSSLQFRTVPEMAGDELAAYTASYDIWVNGSSWHPIPSNSLENIYLVVYPPHFRSSVLHRLRRAVGVKMKSTVQGRVLGTSVSRLSPALVRRLHLLSTVPPEQALASYRVIIANSEFTRALIRRRWGRESQVLYPPVEVEAFQSLAKRRMILSVGRFGRGGNNKKHDALVKAFRALVHSGLRGWELHLAGSTYDDPWNRVYLDEITRMAAGYPIIFHPNAPREELRRLYGESAIYWHGAGYGENEKRNPLRVEHFGITTVEAMAAGCIPIVCGKGGQPEIVAHGINGFLWTRLEDLQRYTRSVADRPGLAALLRDRAIERSQRFGMDPFAAHVREILLGVLGHPRFAHSGRH